MKEDYARDQTMPDMRGDALVKKFRRIRPDVPIILCTGFSQATDADEAKAIGINAFCLKPWSRGSSDSSFDGYWRNG